MRSTIPLFVGLILIALLTLVCSCHVERDVQATADAALAAGGYDWATAEADGRWITLTGTAPNQDVVAAAVSAVHGTEAVTEVYDQTLVHEMSDNDVDPVREALSDADFGWVGIERDDRTLEMSGVATDASQADEAESVARPQWPWGPLDNQIRTAETEADRQLLACRGSLEQVLAEGTVNFESGSAALTPADRLILDQMVSVLDDCADTRVQIEAHTDNTGGFDSNMTLSRARAQSVVDFLVRRGLDANRFTSVGYGETRPIATNATEDGRARNRRVEFRFGL
ncbi:MAG: OmpA family protein [Rhodothermales bacterium]|nr:OmpA family protein [Rhodothermales bacterium]MBO6780281.1 OmpA family protein [Rhodothermales bacterium]